jgi:hypothetical protein
MQDRRSEHHSQRLELLAKQAKDYALHMMRTTGSLPPTVIADTAEGFIFCMPTSLTDDAAKDRFADVARLLAIAYNASAIVMVVEAWAKMPDKNGHLDTNTPPSQSSDRQEIVALMLEDHSCSATSLLPIIRNSHGQFTELGDAGPIKFGESEGRFSGLMKGSAPTAEQSAKAKAALQQLRLSVINRGFDPTLN